MKISKKRLRQIIREERSKLSKDPHLSEGMKGSPSIGFANWQPNRKPDFARSYGSGARVIGQYRDNNTDLSEQPMPAPSSDPIETAFQELKFSGAYKDIQEALHDASVKLEDLYGKHAQMMIQADQESILRNLDDVMEDIDMLRKTFSSLR